MESGGGNVLDFSTSFATYNDGRSKCPVVRSDFIRAHTLFLNSTDPRIIPAYSHPLAFGLIASTLFYYFFAESFFAICEWRRFRLVAKPLG